MHIYIIYNTVRKKERDVFIHPIANALGQKPINTLIISVKVLKMDINPSFNYFGGAYNS